MFPHALYKGSNSDTKLVELSRFLNLPQSKDEAIVDQGFTIEDMLTLLGGRLNIPPFLGGRKQLAAIEVVRRYSADSILMRTHTHRVERAIC